MQHGTHPAPECGVDEAPSVFPFEIFVVQIIVFVQLEQIISHKLWRSESIDVNKGMRWSDSLIFDLILLNVLRPLFCALTLG